MISRANLYYFYWKKEYIGERGMSSIPNLLMHK